MNDTLEHPPYITGWGPPDPGTRLGPSDPAPHGRGRRPRRFTRAVVALSLAGFAAGSVGAAVLTRAGAHTASPVASVAPVTTPAPSATSPVTAPAAQTPARQAPAATTPAITPATTPATTPAGRGSVGTVPSTATPSTAQRRQASANATLTTGLVNITTVLGFQQAEAAGTGIVLSADGRVLTNNHVIDGATRITVTVVATGASFEASVVGTNATDDVALLQLKGASGLAVAPLGDSDTVKVGDAVVGIGNAGGRGTPTTASGVVTALGQSITAGNEGTGKTETLHNLIEVSAQLQPGQSGGPLYGADGKVIGIDTAGSASGSFRMRGPNGATAVQGYAIPINDALAIVAAIDTGVEQGEITIGVPALLGVAAGDDPSGIAGARVADVYDGTPAAQAGLAAGDLITAVDGTAVTSVASLGQALAEHEPGDEVRVTWTTAAGAGRKADVTLIAGPAN